jgi:hypothetical protein
MKKFVYPIFIVFSIVSVLCSMEQVRTESEIPRQADISVSEIFLNDQESTRRILGTPPAPAESDNDFPVVQICNSKATEALILVFHYGDFRDSFNEFRVRNISELPADCITLSKKIGHFITGKGIHLGISKKDLIKILGPDFTEKKESHSLKIHYRIVDSERSSFLRKYNLPIYYGLYNFEGDKLVNFSFGFEYP